MLKKEVRHFGIDLFTVQYDNVSLWGKCWAGLLAAHYKRFDFTKLSVSLL